MRTNVKGKEKLPQESRNKKFLFTDRNDNVNLHLYGD